MTSQNRKEDLEKCLSLKEGQYHEFNIIQDDCSEILRIDENTFELAYQQGYGSFRVVVDTFTKDDLAKAIDIGYDELI